MVVLGLKWLYSGKSGIIWAKLLYSGKSGCIWAKWFYLGKVVFGQRWLFSGIVVLFEQ